MSNRIELLPDPSRMIEGLRDTGYRFNTAVADIVDNSIAADASVVSIDLKADYGGDLVLFVADNGTGMDRQGLINAMRYGSKPRPSAASLGKFGLGLKTASTAFCRKLSVISRDSADSPLLMASWDLDHVSSSHAWELELGSPSEEQAGIFEDSVGNSSGTIVMWERIDRLFNGTPTSRGLARIIGSLREHLGMVYQRFIDVNDTRARNLVIKLNGEEVLPWDPFCVGESEVLIHRSTPVELHDGTIAEFDLAVYLLPRKEDFHSPEAAKRAKIQNNMQGIYIYRENRLIHGPDWLDMFSKEPHFSLLRVEFSFDHHLDELFHIDIKKSQIILDEALWENLRDALAPSRRAAEERYRRGIKEMAADRAKSAHDPSSAVIRSKEAQLDRPQVAPVVSEPDTAKVTNPQGQVTVKIKVIDPVSSGDIRVQPVDSIDDGLLWDPCVIGEHCGVRINTGHPFYHKVYVPNFDSQAAVQGIDALLWALSTAELNWIDDDTRRLFEEVRYQVSRNLRKLVSDLPDAPTLEVL